MKSSLLYLFNEFYFDDRTLSYIHDEFLRCDGFNSIHRRRLIHQLWPLMCTKKGEGLPLICADIFKAE